MIRIAVCDDERAVCDYLRSAVTDLLAQADLDGRVTVFGDGEPLCRAYETGEADFDLIFLDITMRSCDGLTAARRVREIDRDVMIVFVSASAEYVFSGYEVRAFRYLLKPELKNGLPGVFRDCIRELTGADEASFSYQAGGETRRLAAKEILYFESDRRKITVHCAGGRTDSFYGKLDQVEAALKKHDFVRCHQSFLVNARRLSAVRGGSLTLTDGTALPVSKHRAKETNEAFLWAMR